MTRMVLQRCANPKCWRFFPKPIDSPRTECDDDCTKQRAALQAQQARAAESQREQQRTGWRAWRAS